MPRTSAFRGERLKIVRLLKRLDALKAESFRHHFVDDSNLHCIGMKLDGVLHRLALLVFVSVFCIPVSVLIFSLLPILMGLRLLILTFFPLPVILLLICSINSLELSSILISSKILHFSILVLLPLELLTINSL